MTREKDFSEWEQALIEKIVRKLGPDFFKCLKCGDTNAFQTWPNPHYLFPEGSGLSLPYKGAAGAGLFVKTCRECGFTELYCPDAIP